MNNNIPENPTREMYCTAVTLIGLDELKAIGMVSGGYNVIDMEALKQIKLNGEKHGQTEPTSEEIRQCMDDLEASLQ